MHKVILVLTAVANSIALAQVALVQVAQCGPGAFPATACTVSATGSGNLLVVAWSSAFGAVPTISGIADNSNNAYVEAGSARSVDSTNHMVDIWYAKNTNPGANSLTITPNPSGSSGAAVIWEFSGIDTVSPLDQTAVLNSQPATSSPAGAPITTTAPGELVLSLVAPQYWIVSLSGGSGFLSDSILNQSPYTIGAAHLIAPSTGTYAPVWGTGLDTYASSAVSFRAASFSACDLNRDGAVNVVDVQLAVNMALAPANCAAPYGQCNLPFVQAVLTNAIGGSCSLPVLLATPSATNFGTVVLANMSSQTLTLTASGTASTTITQATVSGSGFSISGPTLPVNLTVGQSATFTVSFSPMAADSPPAISCLQARL